MGGLAKVGVAIVIVVAVAGILITPDPSDDVNGILQQRHVVKSTLVSLPAAPSYFVPLVAVRHARFTSQKLGRPLLLDRICVLLC
jgi:hypothetical protein